MPTCMSFPTSRCLLRADWRATGLLAVLFSHAVVCTPRSDVQVAAFPSSRSIMVPFHVRALTKRPARTLYRTQVNMFAWLRYPLDELIHVRATPRSILKYSVAHTARPSSAPCRKGLPRRRGLGTPVGDVASEVGRTARHMICVCVLVCMLRTLHTPMCPICIHHNAPYDHVCSSCVRPHSYCAG